MAYKAKLIATHGGKGKHIVEGINSRLDSIQASFLCLKLPYIIKDTKRRLENAKVYLKELNNLKNFLSLPRFNKNYVYHQFTVKAKKRDLLQKYLREKGVETQIHYKKILPKMKAYKYLKLNEKEFPNSYKLSKEILNLPISPDHTKNQIKLICRYIKTFYSNKINN